MGYFDPDFTFIPFFADKYIIFPDGDAITEEEAEEYLIPEFFYYFELWENFHFFGLPNNNGWANEPKWVIEFLKFFQKAFRIYENSLIKAG